METMQIGLSDVLFANQIRAKPQNDSDWDLIQAQTPDLSRNGVVVADQQALDGHRFPTSRRERIVLVTRNNSGKLHQV
jgi:hypothetical protein